MKKIVSAVLAIVLAFLLSSCTSEKSLYGTWYNDDGGTRNAVQLSENDEGKSVFVWAVYNIEDDEITSQSSGYYHISGDKISFESKDGGEPLELSFELSGDTLRVYNETSSLNLEKYTLSNQE